MYRHILQKLQRIPLQTSIRVMNRRQPQEHRQLKRLDLLGLTMPVRLARIPLPLRGMPPLVHRPVTLYIGVYDNAVESVHRSMAINA